MSNNEIKQSVTVKASREVVFKALSDAGELMRWFPTRVESDARTGGKFMFAWEFAEEENNGSQEGTYTEVIANEKISYGWQAGEVPTTVEFTLNASGDETTVDLVHAGFPAGAEGDELLKKHSDPWGFYMMNLKSYLEEGQDGRTAAIGQKTA